MELCAAANAKINLTLDITGRRADGYHEIESVMQSVSLCDTVKISLGSAVPRHSGISVSIDGAAAGVSCGRENTAFRAAESFFERTGRTAELHIHIEKKIPVCGGLGGGSADAAAVLRLLNAAYGAPLAEDELMQTALGIGADVPFCLRGGTALVRGIGGSVTPLAPAGGLHTVIIRTGEKPSTGEMYARIDRLDGSASHYTEAFLDEYRIGGAVTRTGNIFRRVYAACVDAERELARFAPDAASLSGAGPCLFALFGESGAAQACFDFFRSSGREAYLCTFRTAGVEMR